MSQLISQWGQPARESFRSWLHRLVRPIRVLATVGWNIVGLVWVRLHGEADGYADSLHSAWLEPPFRIRRDSGLVEQWRSCAILDLDARYCAVGLHVKNEAAATPQIVSPRGIRILRSWCADDIFFARLGNRV